MNPEVRRLVLAALSAAPQTCPYHGIDFERMGMQWAEPRCESCRQPWRVTRALSAVLQTDADQAHL